MSGRVPPGGERAIYPVHAMPHKRGEQFCLLRSKVHHLCQPRRSSGVQAEVPKLEPQIEFSVGIFSHKRVKHLSFTVRRSGAILPRNPPRTFHQLLLFCSVASPAPPVLAARESHDPHLLACAGMAVNIHSFHLDHAEQLLGAPGAPAVRSSSAGCCGRLSRWVVVDSESSGKSHCCVLPSQSTPRLGVGGRRRVGIGSRAHGHYVARTCSRLM